MADFTIIAIATTEPRLAAAARSQSQGRGMVLEFGAQATIEHICHEIGVLVPVAGGNRLQKLHICAHGNPSMGYVDIGTGLRAAQTRAFRALRRCWINTGQLAPDACIEMNVCSAAGFLMTPIMMGLAADAGVAVKACERPILLTRLFNPAAGFRTFHPGPANRVSGTDYMTIDDPRVWSGRPYSAV